MTVFPFKTPEQQAAHRLTQKLIQQGYRKQALHCYTDKSGKPIYWRIRLKHPGNHKKWIRPLMQDDSGDFILKEPYFSDHKPLYHLHHIMQHPEAVVWIVEGEWCVY